MMMMMMMFVPAGLQCVTMSDQSYWHAEMYPECVIASWDALVLYGTKGPIGLRKKIECLCKLRMPGKTSEWRISQGN